MKYRKRLKRIEHPGHARFLTFSCYQRMPLFENDQIKSAFMNHLIRARETTGFQLWGWVVMPEHVHLLLRPPKDQSIPKILKTIKGGFSAKVLKRWRELNAPILERITDRKGSHFWMAGGGYDRNIYSKQAFFEKLEYIHTNPVTRGLVNQISDWPWSSSGWYEQTDSAFPMDPIPF